MMSKYERGDQFISYVIQELTYNFLIQVQRQMGKREKKPVEEVDSEQGNFGEKKQQFFECKCGKKYGSLAAVHTHINNKHADDKKAFKQAIKNPKKNGQGPSTSIRMKDINYNEQEADLMCLSDTTVKVIYDFMKKYNEQTRQNIEFLLEQDVIDSSEEQELDEDLDIEPRMNGARDSEINYKIKQMKQRYDLEQIDGIIRNAQQFSVFKLNKFNLTMIRELTKFFNPLFASKVQLGLEIIAAQRRINDRERTAKLQNAKKQIWGDLSNISGILEEYYNNWIELKARQYKSNTANK